MLEEYNKSMGGVDKSDHDHCLMMKANQLGADPFPEQGIKSDAIECHSFGFHMTKLHQGRLTVANWPWTW